MMRRTPIRLLAAVAAIVLAGFAVFALSRDDAPPKVADMNHGDVEFAKGEEGRILNATAATTEAAAADDLAAQGRLLFRDAGQFEAGESCQTCHNEGASSATLGVITHDSRVDDLADPPVPTPPSDFDGPRDAPALWSLQNTAPYFWDGDVATLEAAVVRAMKGHMKAFVTGECSGDAASSEACTAKGGEIAAKLVAYLKTLTPPTTDFDQGTLSAAARRGEKIFQGKGGCIECHGGPSFTDNGVHNTGVPQVTFRDPYGTGTDGGRRMSNDKGAPAPPLPAGCNATPLPEGCEQDERQANSAFVNTPQMRDLAATAPYMHNGAFPTLRAVVDFYNTGSAVSPLNLEPDEIDDLVAYLESL
jgi:cytochrome c peroxidase